jgi:transglutaminase-like putative cysteine protease
MQRLAFLSRIFRAIVSRFWRFGCVFFFAITARATVPDFSAPNIAPPDSWVKPQFYDQQASANPADSSADDYVLLKEKQINALQNETFFHTDRQILNVDGVQNDSTLTINFNPDYESVTLHWVRIWRDGRPLDRLDTNKLDVVQQEKDLDEFMLNGEKSVVLVLDDVRVGDIIDYAYSIKGSNPVMSGHFSCAVPVEEQEPAGRLFTRLIWPRQKALYSKAHGCSVQPATVVTKNTVEFTWDFNQTPAIKLEDSLPAWFDPEQWVQLSDFKTWSEVNQWALKLFQVAPPFSPELSQKIAEWRQLSDQEEEILAALRFVQDDVRYFGIEIGPGTLKPRDPSLVFSRRFGDCKDKSLLLVTILRALGVQADPVLVNATLDRAIGDWQPDPAAFDHCITEVQCNGQVYWLDPTISYQRGPLAAHYVPPYGLGLVVAPWTTDLAAIPQTTGLPRTTTSEYFQIGRANESSSLKVVTVAEGRDADAMRTLFATAKLGDIEKDFTLNYASYYSGVKMSSPIVTEDDEQQNTFQITQFYSIDKMWTQSSTSSGPKYECDFYPVTMKPFLDGPDDTERTLPLAIGFPEHQILRTEVTFPENYSASAGEKTISDPAFTFTKKRECGGNRLYMEYEYQSADDSVSPDRIGEYLKNLDESSKMLGNAVTWQQVMVGYHY